MVRLLLGYHRTHLVLSPWLMVVDLPLVQLVLGVVLVVDFLQVLVGVLVVLEWGLEQLVLLVLGVVLLADFLQAVVAPVV
jgi:hypothetical protein